MKAKKHLGRCTEKSCTYNGSGNICAFSMRERWGCHLDAEVKTRVDEFSIILKTETLNGCVNHNSLAQSIAKRTYDFVFKGHQYTINDNARDQGECPHCGNRSKNMIFATEKDNAKFIGRKKMDKGSVLCFECDKCHEKFFYHTDKFGV